MNLASLLSLLALAAALVCDKDAQCGENFVLLRVVVHGEECEDLVNDVYALAEEVFAAPLELPNRGRPQVVHGGYRWRRSGGERNARHRQLDGRGLYLVNAERVKANCGVWGG